MISGISARIALLSAGLVGLAGCGSGSEPSTSPDAVEPPAIDSPAPEIPEFDLAPLESLNFPSGPDGWEGAFETVETEDGGLVALISGPGGAGGHNIYRTDAKVPDYPEQDFEFTVTGDVVALPDTGPVTIEFVMARYQVNGASAGSRSGMGVSPFVIEETGPFEFTAVWQLRGDQRDVVASLDPALKINANTDGNPVVEISSWSMSPVVSEGN